MNAILLALTLGVGPGHLTADRPDADRGAVRTGPPLTHQFRVTNTSLGPVRILGVTTPCGCLAPAVSPDSLAGGESAVVTLTVNTLTPAAGRQTWRGVVRTASAAASGPPELAELPWSLTAELVREVALTPPALAITAAGARPISVAVTVSDSREKPLQVRGVTATSPHLSVAAGAGVGGTTRLTVTALPTLPDGESSETVAIHTDDPACPELRLPVTLRKRPTAVAVARPSAATLTVAAGQESASTLVQLRSPSGAELKLGPVASDDPRVTATAAAAGRAVTVRVVVKPGAGPSGTAAVRVTLTEPAGVVTIPVSWSRQEREPPAAARRRNGDGQ